MEKIRTFFKKIKAFFSVKSFEYHFSRIFTIAEKNIKLQLRYKVTLLSSLLMPVFTIVMPLIILSKFFMGGDVFGRWDETNYYVFVFMSYNIDLLRRIISDIPNGFGQEKFWKTLPALMIAPFSKFHLLLGIFITNWFLISIPFVIFFVLTYIMYPISFFTILAIIAIYLMIDLIFAGIGLILGIFIISEENIYSLLTAALSFIFWASCMSYPLDVFPGFLQEIFRLNPLYYLFDFIRAAWIDNNILVTISTLPFHFVILVATTILTPIVGILIFNRVYRKLGITGY